MMTWYCVKSPKRGLWFFAWFELGWAKREVCSRFTRWKGSSSHVDTGKVRWSQALLQLTSCTVTAWSPCWQAQCSGLGSSSNSQISLFSSPWQSTAALLQSPLSWSRKPEAKTSVSSSGRQTQVPASPHGLHFIFDLPPSCHFPLSNLFQVTWAQH